jgi:aldehyde oxidoreductase
MGQNIKLEVNGQGIVVEPQHTDWTLVRYLRDVLRLTGARQSCDSEGACGVCTIILDGRARRSCLTPMSKLDGASVETIEALQIERGELPHPLLQTVIQDGIFQCGYCAPGAILAAKALLDSKSEPNEKEVMRAISPVICRCAGLNRMDHSVMRAAAIMRGDEPSTWTLDDTANEISLLERLTGKMKFTDDLVFPGMLYARALRANVPHANVIRVDATKAEKMPGVARVLTAKDLPGKNIFGVISADQPIFCDQNNKVRYVGDSLAVVVAETPEQVEAALQAIEVELEPLPVVSNVNEAIAEGAPVIHERLLESNPDSPNVLKVHSIRKGDIEAGFASADVVVEGEYEVPFVEHAYMETESSIAVPEEGGRITVYCGSQGPEEDRPQIASALNVEKDKAHVAHVFMGGGFGGKEDIAAQIHTALACQATGRPVKSTWDRAESLLVSYKRHPVKMHYKLGAKKDGELVAAEVRILGDTGAYTSAGEAVLFRTMAFACGPYKLPNVNVDSYVIHTNNVPCGAFRGYGSPQAAFGAELILEKLADALGMDSYELRIKNALGLGDVTITGDVLTEVTSANVGKCLQAIKKAVDAMPQPDLEPGEKLGIGYSTAYKNVGLGSNIPDHSGAILSLEPEGVFLVRHGATDMGQGVNDVMAIIAGRVFGVPRSLIAVHTGDTRVDPDGGMTTASRATFVTGNAVLQAAEKLRDQVWGVVSEEFNVPVDDLEIRGGLFTSRSDGRNLISLADLAGSEIRFEIEVTYDAPKTQPPAGVVSSQPEKPDAPMHFAYDYGAQAAIVAVNEETGAFRIIRVIAAHDMGEPISIRNVIGQIEGAVVQGIGYALTERYIIEKGIPQTTRFKDIGLLRLRDIPEIEPIIVEDRHVLGPLGAKGMGELALAPTPPAIANAINNALAIELTEIPITPEKVRKAIQART